MLCKYMILYISVCVHSYKPLFLMYSDRVPPVRHFVARLPGTLPTATQQNDGG